MPRKYNRRKPRRKTRARRSQSNYLPLSGFPKQKMVRLRFCQEFSLASGVSVSSTKSFNANGMYDPDVSVGGNQPRGFDEWMSVYNHFNVVGSIIKVKATGGSNDAFVWGVTRVAAPGYMSGRALYDILETRMQKGMGTVTGDTTYLNTTRRNKLQIAKYSQKKEHGKNATSRSDLVGSNTANPTEHTCFDVWICPTLEAGTGTRTGYFLVQIDFIALLTEPKPLPTS